MTQRQSIIIESFLMNEFIQTNFQKPFCLKSGIYSPIYVDLRNIISHPELMVLVAEELDMLINYLGINYILGVANGGIPLAAIVADRNKIPLGVIHPEGKDNYPGFMRSLIPRKNITLLEDVISTGRSILKCAQLCKELRPSSIKIRCIFSYNWAETSKKFSAENLEIESVLTMDNILPLLKLSGREYESLISFLRDPENWYASQFGIIAN